MKKSISFLLFLILLPGFLISAQMNEKAVYWFTFKIDTARASWFNTEIDSVQYYTIYNYSDASKSVTTGTLNEFSIQFKDNLKKGWVTMGPYNEMETAEMAREIFSSVAELTVDSNVINIINKINAKFKLKDNDQFYWYKSEIEIQDNKQVYFKRTSAAIAFGPISDYINSLLEAKTQQCLLFGPFNSRIEAEISKYYQRLNGEKSSAVNFKFHQKKKIEKMAAKFSANNISDIGFKFNQQTNETTFAFTINFPAKYFEKEAILVLSPLLISDDGESLELDGITLQGERVIDNNPVIAYISGGKADYTNKENISKKFKKLVIKTIYLNNKNLIQPDDIVINIQMN